MSVGVMRVSRGSERTKRRREGAKRRKVGRTVLVKVHLNLVVMPLSPRRLHLHDLLRVALRRLFSLRVLARRRPRRLPLLPARRPLPSVPPPHQRARRALTRDKHRPAPAPRAALNAHERRRARAREARRVGDARQVQRCDRAAGELEREGEDGARGAPHEGAHGRRAAPARVAVRVVVVRVGGVRDERDARALELLADALVVVVGRLRGVEARRARAPGRVVAREPAVCRGGDDAARLVEVEEAVGGREEDAADGGRAGRQVLARVGERGRGRDDGCAGRGTARGGRGGGGRREGDERDEVVVREVLEAA